LANSAAHAYGGMPGREARVEVRLLPEEIQIRFEDTGPPFDPLAQAAPDVEAPLAARPIGGLGIVLVRNLVDRCEYAREGPANVLTLHRGRTGEIPRGAPPAGMPPRGQGGAMALDIEITGQGLAARRVTLRGRLDSLTAPQLETELAPLLDSAQVLSVVFQLEALDYISS